MIKRIKKVPQHIALVSLLVLAIGASGAALLLSRSGQKAEALISPRAARVERVDGRVGVASADSEGSENEWAEAELNTPLSVGDRIYADDDSHAAVALTGRNYARVNPGSALDVLSLSDRRTQLALRSGSAIFDVGELADGELFEVATPHGAVDFYEPGLYQVGIGDDGSSMISVLSGLAQVVGLAGSGEIGRGEMLTLLGQTAAQVLLSRIAPDLAGGIVDDYYDYRYPDLYDGRYNDYDVYLEDPYYYDPYRNSVSYQYVPSHIAGAYDLDYYGDWVDIDGYGQCWSPRVEAGWSPYRQGYWETDEVWGPTWVSDEPWGWAPYHYGRWAHVNNRWVWVVEEARRSPVYAPALVAFVPMPQQQQIAWVPLGPGERYVPRYYDAGYEAHYLASPRVVREVYDQRSFVNLNSPSALTVVPVDQFTGYIAPDVIVQPDPRLIAQASPTLDPFAFQSLRETVVSSKAERRRLKFERRLQREALNTPVVTSVAPAVLERRPDLARAMQFQSVPENQKKRKLKIDDTGQVIAARRADGLPQSPIARQQGPQVAGEAINGAQTKRELKRIERQQRKQTQAQDQTAGRAVALPQVVQKQSKPATATTPREVRKQQKRLDRQQQQAALGEQRRAILEQQAARKQQRRQVVQPQLPTVELKRQQRKAQKQAERQQRKLSAQPVQQQRSVYSAPQVRSAQQSQQQIIKQQRKAERRAARQSAAIQQPRVHQPQVYQPPKNQQQQRVYQQQRYSSQPQVDRQQRKAERRAARQQQAAQQQVVVPQHTYRAPAQAGAASQTQTANKAQRKAEKQAARRAARGKGQHE